MSQNQKEYAFKEQLRAIKKELGEDKESEIDDLTYSVIKIVEAKEGEKLEDIIKRCKSDKPVELISILNDIDKSETLKEGQEVKIVIQKKFKE